MNDRAALTAQDIALVQRLVGRPGWFAIISIQTFYAQQIVIVQVTISYETQNWLHLRFENFYI